MKSKMTLALAASILTLTLSAFPDLAAATTTTNAAPSDSPALRKAGGSQLIYLQVILATGNLLSVPLP